MKLIQSIFPGVLLSIATAMVSVLLSKLVPHLGATTIAILLGILAGNVLFSQAIWKAGTRIAESKFLELAVLMLGFMITLQHLQQIGLGAVGYILLLVILTITLNLLMGKLFGFTPTFSLLMGAGNAVCGSSAIASVSPVVRASEEEKGQSITMINLMGTIFMLTLPIVAMLLYPQDALRMGALLGGTLPSVGQVAGASHLVGEQVASHAMLFKVMRVSLLGFVVILMQRLASDKSQKQQTSHATRIATFLPWYILGFFLTLLINTLLPISPAVHKYTASASFWLEITALSAIGLRLNLASLIKKGGKLLLFSLLVACLQVGVALLLLAWIL
ncbi:YeiH family protein [Entomospira culicis]|uniref:Sulfate exporter family transporter n=1 Tax=Entomospira culicis TaxID=2719989 RepID=A0A968GJ18_9SPIO|nr:putative sulfate exporter family transporter [Entomospira culicis]NIZ19640.1 putative sulfate exporter family transporter [Entomospira culicis]NIZ69854.1 putative sulfate exporter family transporter [Entomospira culicis]WDI36961.1 putative sulfate exporter family transporter [Entomospira culicis]WDI38590.1 putative sulfate exporter family transporter [Entomospira culicis]